MLWPSNIWKVISFPAEISASSYWRAEVADCIIKVTSFWTLTGKEGPPQAW